MTHRHGTHDVEKRRFIGSEVSGARRGGAHVGGAIAASRSTSRSRVPSGASSGSARPMLILMPPPPSPRDTRDSTAAPAASACAVVGKWWGATVRYAGYHPPHKAPVVHHTVRATYGTPEAGARTQYVQYVQYVGTRGKLPCASGTYSTARPRLVRVQRTYGGAPAALRLRCVQPASGQYA